MLLPRTIDKARGLLPGGDPGDYAIEPGWSAWLLREIGFTPDEFLDLVHRAANDDEISAEICRRVPAEKREALNETIRAMRVADAPPDVRAQLDELYGAAPDQLIIDVIVADDRARRMPHTATG